MVVISNQNEYLENKPNGDAMRFTYGYHRDQETIDRDAGKAKGFEDYLNNVGDTEENIRKTEFNQIFKEFIRIKSKMAQGLANGNPTTIKY